MTRLCCLLLLLLTTSHVQAARPPAESWTFSFYLENDLFARTDKFYTNGIKLSWISPELEYFRDLEWLQKNTRLSNLSNRIIDLLPFSKEAGIQRNLAVSIGQMILTPGDISREELITDDRPYGGWLYGSVALHNKNNHKLSTIEIQAGLIGEWSLAQKTQDLVHEITRQEKANGWGNQIANEPGLALIYDRKLRILRRKDIVRKLGGDMIVHYGGVLGNVFTHINAGLEMRFGWNIPTDFGTALIRPAGDTHAPADTSDPRYDSSGTGFSLYLFAAASGRVVLRDIFLDGNTFADSHSLSKELLVGDYILGASLIYKQIKFSYAQVQRTPEFRLQESGQNFGSISISYTY